MLDWERQAIDPVVADLFGFHALQLGLPQLQALRANRMPHRWVASDRGCAPAGPAASAAPPASGHAVPVATGPGVDPTGAGDDAGWPGSHVCCEFDALPFDAGSLDLVVLPHALELARDPHLALAEVERVLRPEGRVVVLGFNPFSLWGLRQHAGRGWNRLRRPQEAGLFLPTDGEFIGYRRLRDWLRLLSFEVEVSRFGCYRPPLRSERWLARSAWTEPLGARWWPVFGAVYLVVAVKRVRGMRLVGLARARRAPAPTSPAVAVQRHEP